MDEHVVLIDTLGILCFVMAIRVCSGLQRRLTLISDNTNQNISDRNGRAEVQAILSTDEVNLDI